MSGNKITAVYVRVNSVLHSDTPLHDTQLSAIYKEFDPCDVREYIDGGHSGLNTDRPQLRQLMKDVEAGLVERVVVYRLDRISKIMLDFAQVMDLFEKHGVELISIGERFDSKTPGGRARMFMIMAMLQMEAEMRRAEREKKAQMEQK